MSPGSIATDLQGFDAHEIVLGPWIRGKKNSIMKIEQPLLSGAFVSELSEVEGIEKFFLIGNASWIFLDLPWKPRTFYGMVSPLFSPCFEAFLDKSFKFPGSEDADTS